MLVRELVVDARLRLGGPFLALKFSRKESVMIDVNSLALQGEGAVIDSLQPVTDPRKPRGVPFGGEHCRDCGVCRVGGSAQFLCDWRNGLKR